MFGPTHILVIVQHITLVCHGVEVAKACMSCLRSLLREFIKCLFPQALLHSLRKCLFPQALECNFKLLMPPQHFSFPSPCVRISQYMLAHASYLPQCVLSSPILHLILCWFLKVTFYRQGIDAGRKLIRWANVFAAMSMVSAGLKQKDKSLCFIPDPVVIDIR